MSRPPANGRRCGRRAAGFTLLELLMVVVLIPVVAITAYSNLSSGIKLWKTLNRPIPEEDLQIFHNKASRDLLLAIKFSPIPFQGDAEKASFVGNVSTRPELGGDRGLGQITYSYDAASRSILRGERDYSEYFADKPLRVKPVLGGVDSCELSYLVYDDQQKKYVWSGAWTGAAGKAPAAVRFTYSITRGGRTASASDTFLVPVGGN